MKQQLSKDHNDQIKPFAKALNSRIQQERCTKEDLINFISIVKEILRDGKIQ